MSDGYETLVHGDLGPTNFVWNKGPVAIIDFEYLTPGPRIDDIAYMAWTWTIAPQRVVDGRQTVNEQAQQVALIANAYGLADKHLLVDAIIQRQVWAIQWCQQRLSESLTDQELAHAQESLQWNESCKCFMEQNRAVFTKALA